jgi:hypothetical protein
MTGEILWSQLDQSTQHNNYSLCNASIGQAVAHVVQVGALNERLVAEHALAGRGLLGQQVPLHRVAAHHLGQAEQSACQSCRRLQTHERSAAGDLLAVLAEACAEGQPRGAR